MSFECESLIEHESQVLELVHLLQDVLDVPVLVEVLDVLVLSDGMPTHISKVTKKLDGVLDFGIGSKPFAAIRLDEDYAARLRSDHIPVVF